jgi:hypothetical protein
VLPGAEAVGRPDDDHRHAVGVAICDVVGERLALGIRARRAPLARLLVLFLEGLAVAGPVDLVGGDVDHEVGPRLLGDLHDPPRTLDVGSVEELARHLTPGDVALGCEMNDDRGPLLEDERGERFVGDVDRLQLVLRRHISEPPLVTRIGLNVHVDGCNIELDEVPHEH